MRVQVQNAKYCVALNHIRALQLRPREGARDEGEETEDLGRSLGSFWYALCWPKNGVKCGVIENRDSNYL